MQKCLRCEKQIEAIASYCSKKCYLQQYREKNGVEPINHRHCRYCGELFEVKRIGNGIGGNNRQYCSIEHSKKANLERYRLWRIEHPLICKNYKKEELKRKPTLWKDKYYKKRNLIIEALGGKCEICGETNKYWLQIDYKNGSKGYGWRHPRNKTFIMEHKEDFQMLCANHHQEKTIKENYKGYFQEDEKEVNAE